MNLASAVVAAAALDTKQEKQQCTKLATHS
jgi:hypothetical protein